MDAQWSTGRAGRASHLDGGNGIDYQVFWILKLKREFLCGNEMASEFLLLPKKLRSSFCGMEMLIFFIWPFVQTAPVVLLLARTISCIWHTMQLGTAVRRSRRFGAVEMSMSRNFFAQTLGGGFKSFLFSPLPGEMIQFD